MTATTFGPAWFPLATEFGDSTNQLPSANDTMLLDADEEEAQFIGYVMLPAGSGSKTFGTSGSKIEWASGGSITFAANSTLTVGVKKASSISTANGPPARATVGAAAFDVFKALVGGTDTINNAAWNATAMASGTPFSVAHGDLIALCFHLDTTSGSPSVKVRANTPPGGQSFQTMVSTLITSGGTVFSAQSLRCSAIMVFDDGTIGWLLGSIVSLAAGANTEAVGNGNIYGLQFRPTVPITVSAMAALLTPAGTTNFDLGIWPAASPGSPLATVSVDPQQTLAADRRVTMAPFATAQALTAGTDYVIGVKQNSATAINIVNFDVNATTHHQANGLDANAFAVKSAGGAAFAAENSSKRRPSMWFLASQFSDGAGGGGGGVAKLAGAGGGFAG